MGIASVVAETASFPRWIAKVHDGVVEGAATQAAHDFPCATRPTTFYCVAATSRSGSTYLCHQLWATGLMGAPTEYFNYHGALLWLVARLKPRTLHHYLELLFALRTSPNGVFGFQAHWGQFEFASKAGLLRSLPGLRFIHIERRDRLAQAVSLARALQTGQWTSRSPARRPPVYDAAQIRACLRGIERLDMQWRTFFARNGIQPIRVTYECLAADPDAVVDAVLAAFGLASDPARRVPVPELRRQSDAVNAEWIERFRRDSSGRDGPGPGMIAPAP